METDNQGIRGHSLARAAAVRPTALKAGADCSAPCAPSALGRLLPVGDRVAGGLELFHWLAGGVELRPGRGRRTGTRRARSRRVRRQVGAVDDEADRRRRWRLPASVVSSTGWSAACGSRSVPCGRKQSSRKVHRWSSSASRALLGAGLHHRPPAALERSSRAAPAARPRASVRSGDRTGPRPCGGPC